MFRPYISEAFTNLYTKRWKISNRYQLHQGQTAGKYLQTLSTICAHSRPG